MPSVEPVAIVGIACRFPGGATDPRSFWELLSTGKDAVTEIPPDRIDLTQWFSASAAVRGRLASKAGGYLDHIDEFDAAAFEISPREAERMDPQQRLLLEAAWEAFEDAGIDAFGAAALRTGVFLGQWTSDFENRLFSQSEHLDFLMTQGSGRYATSGRISYVFGFRGPSLTLDTACSSSLAAIHLACRSLRSGECELALAGGVNVILQPHVSIAYSQSRLISVGGRCRFGDASGDGYVRSEGAGLVLLKPLSRALADGDLIYALVRGSAVNNDGRSSGAFGRPSRLGHEEMLRSAYREAGVDPAKVTYVEAHGTGTRAGDPVELAALGAVLGEGRDSSARCLIGSVKTNIGHTEGAAGIAGVIKTALALQQGAVPATLHFEQPNPNVPWAELPFDLPRHLSPWPLQSGPRLAGVNSFGIAGTNAHVVLEEAPVAQVRPITPARSVQLLPLSARSDAALRALALRYADRIEAQPDDALEDICWSAATRRAALEHRAAFVACDRAAMVEKLRAFGAGEPASAEAVVVRGVAPRVAFLLPGQGAQWLGMGRELILREPVFRAALERCDAAVLREAGWSVLDQLHSEPGSPGYRMDSIDVIQPVLIALGIGYAQLLRSCGVEPSAVVGHSMGEIAAACIAGVLELEQAMAIACRRSSLMHRVSGQGAMALVDLSMQDTQARIAGRETRLSVAVSNSPRSCVVSGDPSAVHALLEELTRDQVFVRLIKVDVASHSPQMQPLAEELAASLRELKPTDGTTKLYSTVLAREVSGSSLDAAYWAANLRQPVLFADTVSAMLADGIDAFIELGPHPLLLTSVLQTAQARALNITTVACGQRDESEIVCTATALGQLWAAGYPLDWTKLWPQRGRNLRLPSYPWQRERHWVEAATAGQAARGGQAGNSNRPRHAMLGSVVSIAANPPGMLWNARLDPAHDGYLVAHRLHAAVVLPASVYLELALAVQREARGEYEGAIRNLAFEQPLYLSPDETHALQVRASPAGNDTLDLTWHSCIEGRWIRHVSAQLGAAPLQPAQALSSEALRLRCPHEISAVDFYTGLAQRGVDIGPPLRSIVQVWQGDSELLARLELHEPQALAWEPVMAPALLDACFQLAAAAAPAGELWRPTHVSETVALRIPGKSAWAHVRCVAVTDHTLTYEVSLFDDDGPIIAMAGLCLERLGAQQNADPRQSLYEIGWQAPDEVVATKPGAAQGRRWIVLCGQFSAQSGLCEALGELITAGGDSCHMLRGGLSPADELLMTQPQYSGMFTEVLDLRGLDVQDVGEQQLSQGLYAVAQLATQLSRAGTKARLRIVTRNACAVQSGELAGLLPAQAAFWGFGAAVAVEHGDYWAGCVDIDADENPRSVARAIVGRIAAARTGDVALRAGGNLEPSLRRLTSRASTAPYRWRADATYLVTGGLGGVGLQLTRWLVGQGARHLAIIGRTVLPARTQWSSLGETSAAGVAVAAIRSLEALGASVHYEALDIGDATALRGFLDSFRGEGWPPVTGVFHAAGIAEDLLIDQLDEVSLRRVLHAKALGAWHLHGALADLELFVMFSSQAVILPVTGQASYAAANSLLDALAQLRRGQGLPALSVAWGAWLGLGMMQGDAGREKLRQLERRGLSGFSAGVALEILGGLLGTAHAHVAVVPVNWTTFAKAHGRVPLLVREQVAQLVTPASSPAASVASLTDPGARRQQIEQGVREAVARVLKLPASRVDGRKPLGALGLSSLLAMELRDRLELLVGRPLSATLAWNYPTVDALVGFLADDPPVAVVQPVQSDAAAAARGAAQVEEVAGLSDAEAALLLRRRR